MQRVSTNLTLFYKIFLPTFWIVFFTSFGVYVWFFNTGNIGNISAGMFKIIYLIFFIVFLLLFYFSIMSLKRVEMDGQSIYVTNYFKHFKYSYGNIEKIVEAPYPFVKLVTIHFKKEGNFGKKIFFVPSKKRFQQFLINHPEVSKNLMDKVGE